jgi:hypothetical protein
MADKKDPKTPPDDFTVDHDSSGIVTMPSITLLLNRKTFTVSKRSDEKGATKSGGNGEPSASKSNPVLPPPLAPHLNSAPQSTPKTETEPRTGITLSGSDDLNLEIQRSSAEGQPEPVKSAVRVQTARPSSAEQRGAQRVTLWDSKQLKSGHDPLGLGLALMLDRGARQALFLAILPAPAGSPVPHFLASAAIAPRDRLKLWTGLKWDPTIVPALWNLFVRTGHAELPPPGTQTDIASNRNVVRAAFGVGPDEWLLLVRTGTLENCRGVLALISDKSMLPALVQAIPLLATPVSTTPAKKAS